MEEQQQKSADTDNSLKPQLTKVGEGYLEWDEEEKHELGKEAAAATDVVSVGKTLVQLSTWTCEGCEVEQKQAARFDVVFSVVPGRNARLNYATVTIRLEDKALKVLELGPQEVQAKDPVKVKTATELKVALDVKAGHPPVATAGPSISRTSNVSHEGMLYPCRVKASVAKLSYARWELYGDKDLGASADLTLPLWIVVPTQDGPPMISCKLDVEAFLAISVSECLPTYTRRCIKKGIPIKLSW